MFATPGELRTIVRFSNGDSTLKSDTEKDVRGMAIKVIGVTGAKAIAEDTGATQDFLLINHPTLMVRNVMKYAELVTRAGGLVAEPLFEHADFMQQNRAAGGLAGAVVLRAQACDR